MVLRRHLSAFFLNNEQMLIYLACVSFFLLTSAAKTEKNLVRIGGITASGWEFLRDLFKENFDKERDVGGSLAIYHQGRLVRSLLQQIL